VEVAPYIVLCGMLYGMHYGMHSRAIATPGVITYVIKGIPTETYTELILFVLYND